MNTFFRDTQGSIIVSWETLIDDIKLDTTYNPYCKSENYYDVFRHIITSMIIGKEIILLDSDFTDAELVKLTGYSEYSEFTEPLKIEIFSFLNNSLDLIEKLKNANCGWKLSLFTSGTTGIPKKVVHNFNSISRFLKYSVNHERNIWGFAYNPTHMAGIQVFLQALLNGNTIVRLFGLSPKEIHQEIKENNITHISATPTFYRLLLSFNDTFPSIKRITSGGERFNETLIKQIKIIFPNAKITNVYASTETGTLFASENDIFTIKPEYQHLIKVNNEELIIHTSLLGNSDVSIHEWYNTGDLIEIIAMEPLKFRFISRKSDTINVGGYKVNPLEVEETIRTLTGIKDVRVYPRSNSVLGNVICCDIVRNDKELEESSIRFYLQSKLQEFKIPRIIRFVDELSQTRTGKIKRSL